MIVLIGNIRLSVAIKLPYVEEYLSATVSLPFSAFQINIYVSLNFLVIKQNEFMLLTTSELGLGSASVHTLSLFFL